MDWSDLFTDEDKFGFELLRNEGLLDFLSYQWLRFRRDWRDGEAEEKLNQIIAVGTQSKGGKGKEGKEGGRTGVNKSIFEAEKLARIIHKNAGCVSARTSSALPLLALALILVIVLILVLILVVVIVIIVTIITMIYS